MTAATNAVDHWREKLTPAIRQGHIYNGFLLDQPLGGDAGPGNSPWLPRELGDGVKPDTRYPRVHALGVHFIVWQHTLRRQTHQLRTSVLGLASPLHQRLQLLACPLRSRYPLHRGGSSLRPVARPNFVGQEGAKSSEVVHVTGFG